jgi:hypothetical protein
MVRENEVVVFGRLLAGEACFMQRLPAREVGDSPAAGRGILAERQENLAARRWRIMKAIFYLMHRVNHQGKPGYA